MALERLVYEAETGKVRYRSDQPAGPTAGSETPDPLEFLARVVSHIPNKGQVLQRCYGAGHWLRQNADDPDSLTIVGVGSGCGDMIMYYAGGEVMSAGTFVPMTLGMTLAQASAIAQRRR